MQRTFLFNLTVLEYAHSRAAILLKKEKLGQEVKNARNFIPKNLKTFLKIFDLKFRLENNI